MKRTAILIMAAALVMVACERNTGSDTPGQGTVEEHETELELSKYAFKVRLADAAPSESKAVVSNRGGDALGITLTAYDEKNEVAGDDFTVVGMVGNIEQFYDKYDTFNAHYHVVKVADGIATLDLVEDSDNDLDNYDECDYFIISSPYDGGAYTDENGNVMYGPLFANMCSKEEMDMAIGGEEVLDIHMLNSTIRVKLTVYGNDAPLTIRYMDVYAEENVFPYTVDYRRIGDMLRNGEFYTHPDYPAESACEVFSSSTIPVGGGTSYLHFCAAPGALRNLRYLLSMEDDQSCEYVIEIVTLGVITAETGKVYDVELSISKTQLESARNYIPHIIADGNSFEVGDTGYGMDNAQMIGDLLKTCPWVYIQKPGTPENYDGIDVSGKVVLVDRGSISFSDKIINASAAGAVGIIIVNNQEGLIMMDLSGVQDRPDRIPAVSTTMDLGRYLLEHPGASLSLQYSL